MKRVYCTKGSLNNCAVCSHWTGFNSHKPVCEAAYKTCDYEFNFKRWLNAVFAGRNYIDKNQNL